MLHSCLSLLQGTVFGERSSLSDPPGKEDGGKHEARRGNARRNQKRTIHAVHEGGLDGVKKRCRMEPMSHGNATEDALSYRLRGRRGKSGQVQVGMIPGNEHAP